MVRQIEHIDIDIEHIEARYGGYGKEYEKIFDN